MTVPPVAPSEVVGTAASARDVAAHRAGVVVRNVERMADLRAVSRLLESVWGRADEGAPVPSEVMRSLAHAGGCTTAAFAADGSLVGAATLAVAAPAGATYSLIAAVAPGTADRGVGRVLKLHQRAWALEQGFRTMRWTFDPLVARNARFNLTRLGAWAGEYAVGFYGRMSDEVNGDDEADRLVAVWDLASPRAMAAADGASGEPTGPAMDADAVADAPDGSPLALHDPTGLWIRVPQDIVALRRTSPEVAGRWRLAVREAFAIAFEHGLVATHATRGGCYLLEEAP